jgi:hypothetical protein
MIGPCGLLLMVPTYTSYSFIGGVPQNQTAKLKHLILLSRVSTSGDALRSEYEARIVCPCFFITKACLNWEFDMMLESSKK